MNIKEIKQINKFGMAITLLLFMQVVVANPEDYFVTTWDTNAGSVGPDDDQKITIQTSPSFSYDYDVDWDNDGIFESTGNTGDSSHEYPTPGIYTVNIRGQFPTIKLRNFTPSVQQLISIDQWGNNVWESFESSFAHAPYLEVNATDIPNTSFVTNMSHMFENTRLANPLTTHWDTSRVVNFESMFARAQMADPDVTHWDVSAAISMDSMFRDSHVANPNVRDWKVSNVRTMSNMFRGAKKAAPEVAIWDVSSVNDMTSMFAYTEVANPDVSGWDMSSVLTVKNMFMESEVANPDVSTWKTENIRIMDGLFRDTTIADPDVSNWDTSKVTSMNGMFLSAQVANPDVSNWDTSKVSDFSYMFANTITANPDVSGFKLDSAINLTAMFFSAGAAQPDVSNWDTSNVTGMASLFAKASRANPNVSNWDTSKVEDMSGMFSQTRIATPDVGDWDTSNVINMREMFSFTGTTAKPNMTKWNVSKVEDMSGMFSFASLPTALYDAILVNFSSQFLRTAVSFDAGDSNFCTSELFRSAIITNFTWAIDDAGNDCSFQNPVIAPDLLSVSDTGVSSYDNVTADNTPTFYILCSAAGNTITVRLDTGEIVAAQSCASAGFQNITTAINMPDGIHLITYTESNNSQQTDSSPALLLTIDTVAPENPIITSPQNGDTTNTPIIDVIGTAEGGVAVNVIVDGGQQCAASATDNGGWTCMLNSELAFGTNLISASATDLAGNQSGVSIVSINYVQDYAFVIIAEPELITTEMGGTDVFFISLSAEPTEDIDVIIFSSNTDEGVVLDNNVSFNSSNWNQPVTITVKGVDDLNYDLDQPYQVRIESEEQGLIPSISLAAINIDDDENPDLSLTITNCVNGLKPDQDVLYYINVKNIGNKDIDGALVTTDLLNSNIQEPVVWLCESQGGAVCDASIQGGDLNQLVQLPVGAELNYTFSSIVIGELYDFVDVTATVIMPPEETDVNLDNNLGADSDLIYSFIKKSGFECSAPGTINSTNNQLENILNSQ